MSSRPMLTRLPSDSPWTVSNQHRFSQRRWRPLLILTLLACSTVTVFKVGVPIGIPISSFTSSSPSTSSHPSALSYSTHPITRMMKEAEERFQAKIDKQSKTLSEAIEEYKHRYGMSPPKVDEYDTLMRDLAPFYALRGQKELGDYTDGDEDPSRPGSGLDRQGWALGGGHEMRRRIAEVASVASIDLVQVRKGNLSTISISKDGFVDDEVSARAHGLKAMLGASAADLPDMDFPVNAKAEGRVIIPWDRWAVAGQGGTTGGKIGLGMGNRSYIEDTAPHDTKGAGNVWDKWRRTCPPTSPARKSYTSIRSALVEGASPSHHHLVTGGITDATVPTGPFAFSSSTSFNTVSYCEQPHLHYTQGHFFSDWRTLDDLYPVLSPARAKGFGDIKIPSHYYYGSTKAYTYGWDKAHQKVHSVDLGEVAWGDLTDAGPDGQGGVDDRDLIIDPKFDGHNNTSHPPRNSKTGKESKRNKIFWRGATTGGGNSPAGFATLYQRHRAVRMADWDAEGDVEIWVPNTNVNVSSTSVSSSSTTPRNPTNVDAPLKAHRIPIAALNKALMDVAFVKASNANQYPGGLKKLQEEHRFAEGVSLGNHWQYKYLLDLDGMSYSGRFMSFLASDSVPVKSTVYEEFFSDWIEPWLHYIPLSSSYEEIYNIFGYFSGIPAEVVEEVYGDAVDPETGAPLFPPGTKVPAIPGAPDGDARLQHIAQAGKKWKNTIARKVDMEAYVYRLALEWARLDAVDREAVTMKV
ncbi:hypothetical protein EV360DRAFT_88684 [Lentinula raphanica]|nr:hypothetical protein EV360DRAFT_88684 [Lentinula raphanica]